LEEDTIVAGDEGLLWMHPRARVEEAMRASDDGHGAGTRPAARTTHWGHQQPPLPGAS